MAKSVRARLTLWYLAVLGLVLCGFAASIYLLLSRSVFGSLDSQLRFTADATALSLNHEIEEHHGQLEGEQSLAFVLRTMYRLRFFDQGIAVYDGTRLVASKPGRDGLLPAAPSARVSQPSFTDGEGAGGPVRSFMLPVFVRAVGRKYLVVTSQSAAAAIAQLATVRDVLLACFPVALLIAGFGGYFLVNRSLAPVAAMTEAVNRITATNLSQQVPVANPGDELGRLAQTFNALLQRLDAAIGQQRQFMADASHELRTPVSVIQSAAQVTLRVPQRSAADYREALEVIDEQSRRLARIVSDMFLLTRADSGGYQPNQDPVYLDELVAETVRSAAVLARHKAVALRFEPNGEAPYRGDEALLKQLVMILVDNAIKYTPAGGAVTVRLCCADDEYRLTVRDTGIGIPAGERRRIFDRFYRIDKARSRANADISGGAGLGLAIARWIAQAHRGELQLVESTAGAGSLFEVRLPRPPGAPHQARIVEPPAKTGS